MFLTRDWIHYNWNARTRITRLDAADRRLEAVHAALAELDRAERQKSPDLFLKVDRILSRINRKPKQGTIQEYAGPIGECARCGNPFPTFGSPQSRFCRDTCREEHKQFCLSRGKPFNRPARRSAGPRRPRRINGQIRA